MIKPGLRLLQNGRTPVAALLALSLFAALGAPAQPQSHARPDAQRGRDALRERMPLGAAPLQAEDAAAGLLIAAREIMNGGRPDTAQRAFEQLVARYPDTEAAANARRELLSLYTARAARDAAPQAAEPSPLRAAAALSSWRTSVMVHRRLQDELRNSIGDRMFFAPGSADLGGRARALILAQADWLQQRPGVDVVVEGHADDAMAGADNDAIATARATAVRDLLVAEGIAAERIQAAPRGARDPIAVCEDSDCAAQNRRAVLLVALRRTQASDNRSLPDADDATAGAPLR